ncbi:MAG: GGDEF domain-containing protein [Ilumatobacteraceae bacterium]
MSDVVLLASRAVWVASPTRLTFRPPKPDTFGVGRSLRLNGSLAWLRLGALVAGVVLVGASVGFSIVSGSAAGPALDRELLREDRKQVEAVSKYFDRARDLMLLEAQNPAFADFYNAPGARTEKIAARNPFLEDAVHSLAYFESLYRGRIGEICFIDHSGAENARLVREQRAANVDLSPNESRNPFFAPTLALGAGQVYQAAAYRSPDTHDIVISNSTVLPGLPAGQNAIVHFEVSMTSFADISSDPSITFLIIDASTGLTISESGSSVVFDDVAPADQHDVLAELARSGRGDGVATVGNRRVAFEHLERTPSNANDWYVVAAAPALDVGLARYFAVRTLVLVGAALALFVLALASFRSYQRRLEQAAMTDPLTGLPNRSKLCDQVKQELATRRRHGGEVAVMVIDLDRFKEVNDTLGHHCGDQLLVAIGPRIRSVLRDGDTIARLGGDEFGLLLPGIRGPAEAIDIADRVLAKLREPFLVGGSTREVEASIGIAIAPQHGDDYTELLQHADKAMYGAKLGAQRVRFQTRV